MTQFEGSRSVWEPSDDEVRILNKKRFKYLPASRNSNFAIDSKYDYYMNWRLNIQRIIFVIVFFYLFLLKLIYCIKN